jgi:hypothetical protein
VEGAGKEDPVLRRAAIGVLATLAAAGLAAAVEPAAAAPGTTVVPAVTGPGVAPAVTRVDAEKLVPVMVDRGDDMCSPRIIYLQASAAL